VELSNQINSYYLFKIRDQTLYLLSEKAIFWKDRKTLILSDLHLGKAAHFRKSGIQIPETVHISDYIRLNKLVKKFKPERIFLIGDLFHSELNKEWEKFTRWLKSIDHVEVFLIPGNHDILPEEFYEAKNLQLKNRSFHQAPFIFVHKFQESGLDDYIISGHIHPAVKISGKAKQSMTLPCFYFSESYAVLPAFGNFTGLAKIRPNKKDDIFIIFENTVLKM
jgi:DNA ligase-associated metallophosphoesterase